LFHTSIIFLYFCASLFIIYLYKYIIYVDLIQLVIKKGHLSHIQELLGINEKDVWTIHCKFWSNTLFIIPNIDIKALRDWTLQPTPLFDLSLHFQKLLHLEVKEENYIVLASTKTYKMNLWMNFKVHYFHWIHPLLEPLPILPPRMF